MNRMGSIVGCFLTKDGFLYRIIDVWEGDAKASAQVLLEEIQGDDISEFKWVGRDILNQMEVVRKDALDGS